ncbi:MAG: hypothetical protein AAGA30_16460 [Planctomycetota bacterium]
MSSFLSVAWGLASVAGMTGESSDILVIYGALVVKYSWAYHNHHGLEVQAIHLKLRALMTTN